MLFGNDRNAMRRHYVQAWRKAQDNAPLDPLESLIAAVIAEHPEYHAMLADEEQALTHEASVEGGTTNPFLHMGMHLAIREQLNTDRPAGIAAAFAQRVQRVGDAHQAEHQMMECLGQALWEAQRNGSAPDEAAYLNCLRKA